MKSTIIRIKKNLNELIFPISFQLLIVSKIIQGTLIRIKLVNVLILLVLIFRPNSCLINQNKSRKTIQGMIYLLRIIGHLNRRNRQFPATIKVDFQSKILKNLKSKHFTIKTLDTCLKLLEIFDILLLLSLTVVRRWMYFK